MKKLNVPFLIVVILSLGVLVGCNSPTTPTPACAACAQETATAIALAIGTATATEVATSPSGDTATATMTSTDVVIATATATTTNTPLVNIWSYTLTGTKAETVCVDHQSTQDGYLTGCSKTADLNSGNGYVANSGPIPVNAGYDFNVWINNTTGEVLYRQLYVNGVPIGLLQTIAIGGNVGNVY